MVARSRLGDLWEGVAIKRGRLVPSPPAVAEVVEESAGVEFVEKRAVAVRCQVAWS